MTRGPLLPRTASKSDIAQIKKPVCERFPMPTPWGKNMGNVFVWIFCYNIILIQ